MGNISRIRDTIECDSHSESKSALDGKIVHRLLYRMTQRLNKNRLSGKETPKYSGEVYFSSLEKHESLCRIYYVSHIKFKISFFWVRRRILDISCEKKNHLFNHSVSLSSQAMLQKEGYPKVNCEAACTNYGLNMYWFTIKKEIQYFKRTW